MTRVTGGTRGAPGTPIVEVLAPRQTGLTISEQPTLYWYLGQPTTARVEATLISRRAAEPLLEVDLGPMAKAGVHALDLADYGVRLEPGAEYRWSVALVTNPDERSSAVVAGGTIKRLELGAVPTAAPGGAGPVGPVEQVHALAERGIWYDAIDAVSELIAAHPADERYRQLRATLLEQEDLAEVADADRTRTDG